VQEVRAELIAISGETKFINLTPLSNGISAITLVWPIDHPTKDRVAALKAGVSSVVSGGTSSRSSYQISEFMDLKGASHHVEAVGQNLVLTVSAPNEFFPETLVHLENLLLEPEYSSDWYARRLEYLNLTNSTITRRPSDVLNEVTDFLEHEPGEEATGSNDGDFRFGRPTQVILRSEDLEVERRTLRLMKKLPTAKTKWALPIAKWVNELTGDNEKAFLLPKGVIHFADPNSTEMLILFVSAKEFANANDQLGANLLVDYIGANQGSEMFRIIRQTMRAAYDPRSDFIVMGKNKAVISLSATVEALEWPEIYSKIKDIYQGVRSGSVEQESLEVQLDKLDRSYYYDFYNDPVWGVRQYLHEHPQGVDGEILIPLFAAFQNASSEEIIEYSEHLLPPFEEFLVILIGGGNPPSDVLQSEDYCSLPKGTRLRFCLDDLSNAENL
jgi:hypothetical protein